MGMSVITTAAPGQLSSPVRVNGALAFQPNGIANNALGAANAVGAVTGLQIVGEATAAGATGKSLINTGVQINVVNPSGSEANYGLVINPVGSAWLQFVQTPQAGGIIVANATQNTGGAGYGSGMFNGAIQIFRPSGSFGPAPLFDAAMPWLLMGDSAGKEQMSIGTQYLTVNYVAPGNPPTASGKYTSFVDSLAGDLWIRQIGWVGGVQSYIRLGFASGDAASTYPQGIEFSTLAITNDVQDPVANGFTFHGTVSGTGPIIEFRGVDTNVGGTIQMKGSGNLIVHGSALALAYATNPTVVAGNAGLSQEAVLGMATSAGAFMAGTATNDVVIYSAGSGNVNIGNFGAALYPTGYFYAAVANQVNGVAFAGSATGTDPEILPYGGDAVRGLTIASKGGANAQITIGPSGKVVVVNAAGVNNKLGFYGATPVARAAVITAPSGGSTIDTQARTAITSILNVLGAAAGGVGLTA